MRTRIFGTVTARCGSPSSSRPTARPASTGAPTTWCPGCAPASASRARRGCRRARRSRRATAPCSRRARRASARPTRGRPGRRDDRPGARRARRRARGSGRPDGRGGRPDRARARVRRRAARHAGRHALRGRRVIATSFPQRGSTAHTTIDPKVQKAAVEALAGRFGGIAVVRPRTGEVLALAGIAYSAPQPPGSTFKIVTLAGALQSGVGQALGALPGLDVGDARGRRAPERQRRVVRRQPRGVVRGVLQLGVRAARRQAGRARLVATAERFGFNEDPALAGAARSTIPAARRSATTSRSARARSARARCSPRRC